MAFLITDSIRRALRVAMVDQGDADQLIDVIEATAAVAASLGQNFVTVASVADLPKPVGNMIQLHDETAYFTVAHVDLLGLQLKLGKDTVLTGTSSETAGYKSTGLDPALPLLTGTDTAPIRDIYFTHALALSMDATASGNPDAALDWRAVNFVDCARIGRITGYANFILVDSAFLNSGGCEVGAISGTFGSSGCLFRPYPGTAAFEIDPETTIDRRFRIIYSSMVVVPGTFGIKVDTSSFPENESFILDTVNFAGGGGYLVGTGVGTPLDATQNQALIHDCVGVDNSANVGHMYMSDNASETTIDTIDVFVKAVAPTTAGVLAKFTHTSNRLTYIGARTSIFTDRVTVSLSGGGNRVYSLRVAKNGVPDPASQTKVTTPSGGRVDNVPLQWVGQLEFGDYLEVWVANTSNTDNATLVDTNSVVSILT